MILVEKATFDIFVRDDKDKIIKTIPLDGYVKINKVCNNLNEIEELKIKERAKYLSSNDLKITLRNLNINLHIKEL